MREIQKFSLVAKQIMGGGAAFYVFVLISSNKILAQWLQSEQRKDGSKFNCWTKISLLRFAKPIDYLMASSLSFSDIEKLFFKLVPRWQKLWFYASCWVAFCIHRYQFFTLVCSIISSNAWRPSITLRTPNTDCVENTRSKQLLSTIPQINKYASNEEAEMI